MTSRPARCARIFVLSPARLDGARAQLLFAPRSSFALAAGLRTREGVPIGHVFRFLSGLYFRGKLAYAERFAQAPEDAPYLGVLVITQSRGLVPASTRVTLDHLEAFAQTEIGAHAPGFRTPLERDARAAAEVLGAGGACVLLGSIATPKYVEPLTAAFGERLLFPSAFVGRGDMSRGALLLRAVEAGAELAYEPVATAVRHGKRPPKLAPRARR